MIEHLRQFCSWRNRKKTFINLCICWTVFQTGSWVLKYIKRRLVRCTNSVFSLQKCRSRFAINPSINKLSTYQWYNRCTQLNEKNSDIIIFPDKLTLRHMWMSFKSFNLTVNKFAITNLRQGSQNSSNIVLKCKC